MDEFVKFIGQNMPWALVGLSFSLGCLAGYGLFDLIEWLRKRAIARIKQSDTAAVDGLASPADAAPSLNVAVVASGERPPLLEDASLLGADMAVNAVTHVQSPSSAALYLKKRKGPA